MSFIERKRNVHSKKISRKPNVIDDRRNSRDFMKSRAVQRKRNVKPKKLSSRNSSRKKSSLRSKTKSDRRWLNDEEERQEKDNQREAAEAKKRAEEESRQTSYQERNAASLAKKWKGADPSPNNVKLLEGSGCTAFTVAHLFCTTVASPKCLNLRSKWNGRTRL
jgi:hypothetical protein